MTHISRLIPRDENGFKPKGTWCDKKQVLELIRTYKTRSKYKEAIRCGADIPSVHRIEKWYGNWTNARNAAGVAMVTAKRKNNGSFTPGVPTAWYFLYFPDGDYYKTGITTQELKRRFTHAHQNNFEIIEVKVFDCGSEAYAFEEEYNKWLDSRPEVARLEEKPYWDVHDSCGWTECFYLKSS